MSHRLVSLLAIVLVVALVAPPAWAKRGKKKKGKKKAPRTEQVQAEEGTDAERAEALAMTAQEAYTRSDLEATFDSAQQALVLDPENARALRVRGRLLLDVGINGQMQGDPTAPQLISQGIEDLQRALALAPEAPESAEVRELLLILSGSSLFPDPEPECPDEAREALHEAEEHFGQGELDEAAEDYERALAGCPGHAVWWMYYGDVFFLREDYEGALEKFDKALEIEPCFWRAHRFKSDTHHRLGDLPNTYRSALTAVACNPTYEKGWEYLGQTMDNYGGTLRRVAAEWPGPVMTEGGPLIAVAQPDGDDEEASRESALMLIYNLGRVPLGEQETPPTPLALERQGVGMGLSFLGEDAANAGSGLRSGEDREGRLEGNEEQRPSGEVGGPEGRGGVGPDGLAGGEEPGIERHAGVEGGLESESGSESGSESESVAWTESERPMLRAWQLLAEASRYGVLDEAIFMLRLDESLLPEFLAFREAHLDRLIAYTATHLAPLDPDSEILGDLDAFYEALPELRDPVTPAPTP